MTNPEITLSATNEKLVWDEPMTDEILEIVIQHLTKKHEAWDKFFMNSIFCNWSIEVEINKDYYSK